MLREHKVFKEELRLVCTSGETKVSWVFGLKNQVFSSPKKNYSRSRFGRENIIVKHMAASEVMSAKGHLSPPILFLNKNFLYRTG